MQFQNNYLQTLVYRQSYLSELHDIFKTVMRSYVAKSGDKCCTCDPDTAFL